jgi:chromosomal replication initiation ATPase DnaA
MMHRKDNVTPAVNASFGLSTMLQTDDRTLRDPRPASRNVSPDDRVLRVPREAIEQAVVQVFGVGQEDLRRITRGRAKVALARQVAMYLAHVVCGLTLTDTGRHSAATARRWRTPAA